MTPTLQRTMDIVNREEDTIVTDMRDKTKKEEDLEIEETVTISEEGVPVDFKEEATVETERREVSEKMVIENIEVEAIEKETAGEVIVKIGDKMKEMGTRTKEKEVLGDKNNERRARSE